MLFTYVLNITFYIIYSIAITKLRNEIKAQLIFNKRKKEGNIKKR